MTSEKDKAEAYVRSQIPELMELSFGCRFRANNGFNYIFGKERLPDEIVVVRSVDQGHYEAEEVMKSNEIFFIIGHPIQLHHWLWCIDQRLEPKLTFFGSLLALKMQDGQFVNFCLKKGSPDTEKDYKAFNSIVGV